MTLEIGGRRAEQGAAVVVQQHMRRRPTRIRMRTPLLLERGQELVPDEGVAVKRQSVPVNGLDVVNGMQEADAHDSSSSAEPQQSTHQSIQGAINIWLRRCGPDICRRPAPP